VNVVYVFADSPSEWNCSEWRCKAFADAFNRHPEIGVSAKLLHVSGFLEYLSDPVQYWLGPADLIIFQRNAVNGHALDAIAYWRGLGKPLAIDLDDAYHILPWSNPAHHYWHVQNDGVALLWLERALAEADALISPNQLLLGDWAHVCRGYLIPNFARPEWWGNLPSREEAKRRLGVYDRIVIGWGGSVSHYDSWFGSGLREAAKVLAEMDRQLLFLICGNDPRIVDSLPVPVSQKLGLRGVPPEDWPKVVRAFDIGVAPLFGPYDQRRSWIKGLEYLLAEVPWIATRGVPYAEMADLGWMVENRPDSWIDAIWQTVQHLSEAQDAAASRRPIAENWLVDNQLAQIKEAYLEIIRNRRSRSRLPNVGYFNWWPEPGRDPERSFAIVSNPFQEFPRLSGYSHCARRGL
jgi:hypothetical protein